MPRELLARLDHWTAAQVDQMSRPEAVRRLVDEALGKPQRDAADARGHGSAGVITKANLGENE